MAEIIVYPHDSERIFNQVNEQVTIPSIKQLEMINVGPAKMVVVLFQTATQNGRFQTVVEKNLIINHEGVPSFVDIPQEPVYRWRIVVQNDTDMKAQITYITN